MSLMDSVDILHHSTLTLSKKRFSKRSLNWKENFNLIARVLKHLSFFRELLIHPKISRKFQEQILLAVTSVNDCPYCSYFHMQVAIESGCEEQEIQQLLDKDLSCADPEEFLALAFAQHFAESRENPSRKSLLELIRYYGIHRAKQIIASCWMITIGNLYGNTVDAYRNRLMGRLPKNGNRLFEALLYYSSIRVLNKFDRRNH
ncbi:carboxymuconolactone decarboxylase family protein [Candidatus Harpocratesius sp.]